jgi:hypothetical protein
MRNKNEKKKNMHSTRQDERDGVLDIIIQKRVSLQQDVIGQVVLDLCLHIVDGV